jgi:hypothetical protein
VANSYALFDDLKLVGGFLGISDNPLDEYTVFYADNSLFFERLPESLLKDMYVELFDLTGRVILEDRVTSNVWSLGNLKPQQGIYTVRLKSDQFTATRKIFIN